MPTPRRHRADPLAGSPKTLAQLIEERVPGVKVRAPAAAGFKRTTDCERMFRGVVYKTRGFPRYYFPNTPQKRAHALQDRRRGTFARFLVMCAGRRGGKTKSGAAQFVANILDDLEDKLWGRGKWAGEPHPPWEDQPGKDPEPFLRYFVLAPTHALNDEPKIALRRYLGHVDDAEPGLIVDQDERPSVWWLKGGIRIDFLSGDTPNLNVSHGYDGGWFEEAARLKAGVWRDNMRPSLSDKRGWVIFTTTPLGRNWFYEDVWAAGDPKAAVAVAKMRGCTPADVLDAEFACVAWTTADNDALPHLREEMEIARRQMSDANWRRNYKADFDAFEGQCFDLTDEHFVPWRRGARLKRVYAGFDPGLTHPASFTVVGQRATDNDWHAVRTESGSNVEPYGDDAWKLRDRGDRSTWANRLYHALRELMGDLWRSVPVYLPTDQPVIKLVWERYGFNVQAAYQDHEDGMTWIQTALKNKRLTIGSEALWNCMLALHFPEPGKRSTKLWVDEHDDEFDGLRYALSAVVGSGEAPTRAPLSAMGWNRV